jgi:hypothetical protein
MRHPIQQAQKQECRPKSNVSLAFSQRFSCFRLSGGVAVRCCHLLLQGNVALPVCRVRPIDLCLVANHAAKLLT